MPTTKVTFKVAINVFTNGIKPSFRYQYKYKSVTPKTVYFELEKMFISKYRPQLEINHLLSQPDQSQVWKFHGSLFYRWETLSMTRD